MKKMFAALIILIFAVNVINAQTSQTWTKAHQFVSNSLTKILMLDNTNGWVVGGTGLIKKTNSGGLFWEDIATTETGSLYGITFPSANVGYVGADSQKVMKTTDGGTTWNDIIIANANGTIKALYFIDENTGYVMVSASAGGQIFKTADGGSTWTLQLQASKDLLAMSFSSPTNGIVTGKDVGTIYYTTDGSTWTNAAAPSLGGYNYTRSDIWAIYMVNNSIAYAAGWGSAAAGLQPSIHLKTTDGGATWIYQDLPEEQRTYVNFEDIYFKNELEGYCVGGSSSYNGAVVLKTTDGGANWTPLLTEFGSPANSIQGNGDELWIAGDAGLIGHSLDGGQTWEMVNNAPSVPLYSIKQLNANTFYAAGFSGGFIKTTDGGHNWKGGYIVVDNKSPKVCDIQFVNENVGYAARGFNQVCKTTDGGNTWFAVIKDSMATNLTFNGLFFLDENNGFVVGRTGNSMLKTTDGGNTWSNVVNGAGVDLNDVHFFDLNNGVIVGKTRTIKYTTDGGATWNNSTLNNIPGTAPASAEIKDIDFVDNKNGFATGAVTLKTVDGGITWEYVAVPDPTVTLTRVNHFSADRWFVAGGSVVFETTDGGANWTTLSNADLIISNIGGACYDYNGFNWVVGYSSTVFTTAPLSDVETEIITANSFNLEQNYPNPFNPSTIINYTIAKAGTVELSVYNLLGQKVSTLVNSEQSVGNYSINFNAENLSSGVYFYTLKVDNLTSTKKMMLIR